jgi:hypothetical protein
MAHAAAGRGHLRHVGPLVLAPIGILPVHMLQVQRLLGAGRAMSAVLAKRRLAIAWRSRQR